LLRFVRDLNIYTLLSVTSLDKLKNNNKNNQNQ
jgi:hypothetical protein